jgi:hypothetical protein
MKRAGLNYRLERRGHPMSKKRDREKLVYMSYTQEYIDAGMPNRHLRGAQLIHEPLERPIVSSRSVPISQSPPEEDRLDSNIQSSE